MSEPINAKRLFCRVILVDTERPVLMTTDTTGIKTTNDGQLLYMNDLKMGKIHVFNVDKVIHIQFEDERVDA